MNSKISSRNFLASSAARNNQSEPFVGQAIRIARLFAQTLMARKSRSDGSKGCLSVNNETERVPEKLSE